MNPHLKSLFVATAMTALLCVPAGRASGLDEFNVHGSLSATASYSDKYAYLGDTKDQLSLNLVDIILNSTHRFDSGLRAGAQVYGFKLGQYRDLTLDFANLDYAFNPRLGLRVGRNKLPHGLYNDSQDLDSVRTFASLPFSFYPRTLRAIVASFDGAVAYGTFELGRAGSLDYQVFAGAKESVSGGDNPLLVGISTSLSQFNRWKFEQGVQGLTLFWNLPIEGLKFGYSLQRYPHTKLSGVIGTSHDQGAASVAAMVDATMGKGVWDYSGYFAGTPATVSDIDVLFRTWSLEYSRGKWVWAAEYKLLDQLHGKTYLPALARLGQSPNGTYHNNLEYWYGMATYQLNDKLGFGYYYARNTDARNTPSERWRPDNTTTDHAVVASYNVTKWCTVKAEYHFMDGFSTMVMSGDPLPPNTSDTKWQYLVLKTTVSF